MAATAIMTTMPSATRIQKLRLRGSRSLPASVVGVSLSMWLDVPSEASNVSGWGDALTDCL